MSEFVKSLSNILVFSIGGKCVAKNIIMLSRNDKLKSFERYYATLDVCMNMMETVVIQVETPDMVNKFIVGYICTRVNMDIHDSVNIFRTHFKSSYEPSTGSLLDVLSIISLNRKYKYHSSTECDSEIPAIDIRTKEMCESVDSLF